MARDGEALEHCPFLDRAVMAAASREPTASEGERLSRENFGRFPSGIHLATLAAYEGVKTPEHIRDALNRMARR